MSWVWLAVAYFGEKKIIHCYVQPYTPTFRNRKSGAKDFRGSDAAAKAWLREDFAYRNYISPPKAQKLSFRTVHETVMRKRRATSARIWGFVRSKTILVKMLLFIYSSSQQDLPFRPARCREMTTAECHIYV